MTEKIILLLTGPNLDLLGQRDPKFYGSNTLDDYESKSRATAERFGFSLEHLQSAVEAELVTAIHRARNRCAAIVINAGAFTHYAWAIADALELFTGPVIEVHVSNPNARQPWRHTSVVSPVASGIVAGLGIMGYELAIEAAARSVEARTA
jgi:3-dehydroquinate dehydratase II